MKRHDSRDSDTPEQPLGADEPATEGLESKGPNAGTRAAEALLRRALEGEEFERAIASMRAAEDGEAAAATEFDGAPPRTDEEYAFVARAEAGIAAAERAAAGHAAAGHAAAGHAAAGHAAAEWAAAGSAAGSAAAGSAAADSAAGATGPSIAGSRTALLRAARTGQPRAPRPRLARQAAPFAALLLALAGAGWWSARGALDSGGAAPGRPDADAPASDLYLGGGSPISDRPPLAGPTAVAVSKSFDGTLDWEDAHDSLTGQGLHVYRVSIRTAPEDGAGEVLWTSDPLSTPHWTCPPELRTTLPTTFVVEVTATPLLAGDRSVILEERFRAADASVH